MWFKEWFQDDRYLTVYSHRDEDEARLTVDLFERTVHPPEYYRILDLGCGNGRHAIEFARRGYRVTGIDLSLPLLNIARRQAEEEHMEILFIHEDMRRLSEFNYFHAVVNLFTSFGYFAEDRENSAVIGSVAHVLKRDGWFMLDFFNAEYVERTLIPYDEKLMDGTTIIQERSIEEKRINKTITIRNGDGENTFYESVRFFTRDELTGMLRTYGFDIMHEFGSYDGTPVQEDSPRVILFGQKR